MSKTILTCPKCGELLNREGNVYKCVNRHSYDVAKEGYVNLLLANQKNSKEPGDSSESLISRREFLNQGYYEPLAMELKSIVGEYFNDGETFLDAGCGTGYYLDKVKASKDLDYYAVDIAKKGVAMCAKLNKEATCFVGSVFHLPFNDGSLNGLMSVFCPYSAEEFSRVIKDEGYVIAVTPGKQHLFQLKEVVYQNPYENDEAGYNLPDFKLLDTRHVTYKKTLLSKEDISTLWKMTPYYHTTYIEDSEKLLALDSIETTISFLVSVYQKEKK